jgi:hypothetical protein
MRLHRSIAAVVLMALTGCSGALEQATPSPADVYLEQPADLKRGRLLFRGTCGGYCHPTSPGNRDSPYLFDCEWKNGGSDAEIFVSISAGVPDSRMPSYGGRMPERDRDIWRLIAYIRSKSVCESTR